MATITTLGPRTGRTETANTYTAFSEMFECRRYPAGESHIELMLPTQPVEHLTIEAAIVDFEGLGNMLTADRILRRNGIRAQWFVPYFPFARHDRRNHIGDGFELGVALDLVKDLDIVIADPHSDVAGQLPHIPQSASVECFRDAGLLPDHAVIVIPDAGATKKAHEWATGPVVQALKHRDTATGRLSGFEVLARRPWPERHVSSSTTSATEAARSSGSLSNWPTRTPGRSRWRSPMGSSPKASMPSAKPSTESQRSASAAAPRVHGVDYLPFKNLYNKGARR